MTYKILVAVSLVLSYFIISFDTFAQDLLPLADGQMSYEEAAVAMDCNLGTVKSRVSRGRRGLRECLQKSGELLPSRFRHT